jgi:hypothetical protein
MKPTVAIVGSHPRTRAEFDFSRTDCDIWLFNEAISNPVNRIWAKRADAIFQMHEPAIWRNPANRNDPHHYEWLKTQTETAVYMQEQYDDIPASRRYPLEDIVARFGVRYFTSSVAYALALACHLGYERMELYGVEMETNTEYQYQRDGVTLWLGVAHGLGMVVDAHISMLDQPLYGYEGEVVFPYSKFVDRIAELQPEIEQASAEYNGAAMDIKKAVEMFVNDASSDNEQLVQNNIARLATLGSKLGSLDGAKQENERYKKKADQMREASGGEFLFSRQEFEASAKNLSDKASEMWNNVVATDTKLGIISKNIRQAAKGSPKRQKFGEIFLQEIKTYLQASNQTYVYRGAAGENFAIMSWMDKHIRAAGGSKSEAVLLESLRSNEMVAA